LFAPGPELWVGDAGARRPPATDTGSVA